MSKLSDRWDAYVASVPGFCAAIQPPPIFGDDSDLEYSDFAEGLPEDVSERLDEIPKQSDETEWSTVIEHQWCLCEMPEGDFPRVFAFPSLARLVDAIAKREGNEVAVWPMYGVPLRLTQTVPNPRKPGSRLRYLLLPNQLAAVIGNGGELNLIDQSLLPDNLGAQDEGWLGDPDLLQEQSYFKEGYIDDDKFSDDPDMDDDDDDGDPNFVED